MADLKSVPSCASPDSIFNTGVPLCDLLRKQIIGVIYSDKGVTFSSADMASSATFIAAVKTKTTAARGGRVYPVWDIQNFEDNTGDPSQGGVGNLSTAQIITQDAVPLFSFGYPGGEKRHKMMSNLAAGSYDVFFVDSGYAVYGCDSGLNMKGYATMQNYVDAPKFIVSDAVNLYRFRTTLTSITEYRDQSAFFVTNSGIKAAVGLINVVLVHVSGTGNAKTIEAIADGGTNMQTAYGATLANVANWTAKNMQTGAAFTITSVTQSAPNFIVTLDTTAWTALASGDKVQINLASAATLNAAGVTPFEGIAIIVTKP